MSSNSNVGGKSEVKVVHINDDDDDDVEEVGAEFNDTIAQQLVEQFVKITNTDEALAQFYLQDREWKLDKSVNDYFDDLKKSMKEKKTRPVIDLNDDEST